jgi:hypothetical protein
MDAEHLIFERTESRTAGPPAESLRPAAPRDRRLARRTAPLGRRSSSPPRPRSPPRRSCKRPEALLAEALSWIGPAIPDRDDRADLERCALLPPRWEATSRSRSTDRSSRTVMEGSVESLRPDGVPDEFERTDARINDTHRVRGHAAGSSIDREVVGNRTDWVVRFTVRRRTRRNTMRYTFSDGYLIAAPSRALIDRPSSNAATATRWSARTPFVTLLPSDNQINVSGFVWEHLGPTVGPLRLTRFGHARLRAGESARSHGRRKPTPPRDRVRRRPAHRRQLAWRRRIGLDVGLAGVRPRHEHAGTRLENAKQDGGATAR